MVGARTLFIMDDLDLHLQGNDLDLDPLPRSYISHVAGLFLKICHMVPEISPAQYQQAQFTLA